MSISKLTLNKQQLTLQAVTMVFTAIYGMTLFGAWALGQVSVSGTYDTMEEAIQQP